MANKARDQFPADAVRDDFVPKEAYFSREFFELEKERLWPRVWQIACREEEIPYVGDFVTYDILDDSIIVTRSAPDRIQAFHNVCPHRGNRLTEGCAHAKQFTCSFHGWRFGLDGRNVGVVDRKDWGDRLSDDDVRLKEVKSGRWAGFVWINMDDGCQTLEDLLTPIVELTSCHEFEKLRYAWYRTTVVEANWKVVAETFNEFYHVQTTHNQMLTYTNDYSASKGVGRHGWVSYAAENGFPIARSPRLAKKDTDFRDQVFEYAEQLKHDLNERLRLAADLQAGLREYAASPQGHEVARLRRRPAEPDPGAHDQQFPQIAAPLPRRSARRRREELKRRRSIPSSSFPRRRESTGERSPNQQSSDQAAKWIPASAGMTIGEGPRVAARFPKVGMQQHRLAVPLEQHVIGQAKRIDLARPGLRFEAFRQVVADGASLPRGMPRFEMLSADELRQLHSYIRAMAREALGTRKPSAPQAAVPARN